MELDSQESDLIAQNLRLQSQATADHFAKRALTHQRNLAFSFSAVILVYEIARALL